MDHSALLNIPLLDNGKSFWPLQVHTAKFLHFQLIAVKKGTGASRSK
jgi:hypothetical protein